MDEEYEAIRAEMLQWQDRRIDLLKISTALVAGVLGLLKILSAETFSQAWPYLAAALLLFLAASVLLTWYAGEANRKLASYIRVFFEDKKSYRWETRLNSFNSLFHARIDLNLILVVVYAALAIASVLVPAALTKFKLPEGGEVTLVVGAGLFLSAAIITGLKRVYPVDYDKIWKRVQTGEK